MRRLDGGKPFRGAANQRRQPVRATLPTVTDDSILDWSQRRDGLQNLLEIEGAESRGAVEMQAEELAFERVADEVR